MKTGSTCSRAGTQYTSIFHMYALPHLSLSYLCCFIDSVKGFIMVSFMTPPLAPARSGVYPLMNRFGLGISQAKVTLVFIATARTTNHGGRLAGVEIEVQWKRWFYYLDFHWRIRIIVRLTTINRTLYSNKFV